MQQHGGYLVSTTNAEDYTVHASTEMWTDINTDESQTCLGAAILMGIRVLTEAENYREFLSLFSRFHNSSGYDTQEFKKAD